MKKLSLFLVPSLALALTACQNDDGNAGSVQSDGLQAVRITVNIPELMQTRAADTEAKASDALFGPTSNSAMGGLTNLKAPKDADHGLNKYDLRYKLAVYRADGISGTDTTWTLVVPASSDATYNTLKTKQSWQGGTEDVSDTKEEFTVRLTADRDYKVVCWADFVEKGKTDDLHYDTKCFDLGASSTTTINIKDDPDKQLNDESRDAYYVQKNFYVAVWTYGEDGYDEDGNQLYKKGDTRTATTYEKDVYDTSDKTTHKKIHSAGDAINFDTDNPADPYFTQTLVLRRPFSKVRVVTTDWTAWSELGDTPPNLFKITYYGCKRFNNFKPTTGETTSTTLDQDASTVYTGPAISNSAREYALDYDMHQKNRTLTVDYLMTDATQETAIGMKFEAFKTKTEGGKVVADGDAVVSKTFDTDIPIKRNWLTTILGNLLTKEGKFTISISENFIDEKKVTY